MRRASGSSPQSLLSESRGRRGSGGTRPQAEAESRCAAADAEAKSSEQLPGGGLLSVPVPIGACCTAFRRRHRQSPVATYGSSRHHRPYHSSRSAPLPAAAPLDTRQSIQEFALGRRRGRVRRAGGAAAGAPPGRAALERRGRTRAKIVLLARAARYYILITILYTRVAN